MYLFGGKLLIKSIKSFVFLNMQWSLFITHPLANTYGYTSFCHHHKNVEEFFVVFFWLLIWKKHKFYSCKLYLMKSHISHGTLKIRGEIANEYQRKILYFLSAEDTFLFFFIYTDSKLKYACRHASFLFINSIAKLSV